jgi:hypothetical protein
MLRRLIPACAAIFLLAAFLPGISYAARHILANENVAVSFDAPLQNAAAEVLKIYPGVRAELSEELGWGTNFRPQILLIKENASFRRIASSDLVVAEAIPREDLIVIDYSRMNVQPFTLGTTLKHELCHLVLHRHIAQKNLPRWFDEGVCQWVTGGLAEIMTVGNRSMLREAALSHRLISFERLTERFPADGRDLLLAYEESRSVVDYIRKEFGVSGVRMILEYMSEGDDLDNAFRKSLSMSSDELEKRWRSSIVEKTFWLSYIGDNIYVILFAFAALITVYGFFRILKKRREYRDEEEEDDEGEI